MSEKDKKKTKPPRISEAEWIVMKPLWEKGDLAARDIYASLPPNHKWSYKTVKTMLARLVKKGVLEFSQIGNSYLYHPGFTHNEMVRYEVKTFSRRVLDGTLKPFLVNFFEGRRPSSEEISALKELIKTFRENKPPYKERRDKNDK